MQILMIVGLMPTSLGHPFSDNDPTSGVVIYSFAAIATLLVMIALIFKARKKRRKSQSEAARKRK